MTKSFTLYSTFLLACFMLGTVAMQAQNSVEYGRWKISYDETTRMVTFSKDGNAVLSDVVAQFKSGSTLIKSTSYTDVSFSTQDVNPATGPARKFTITYKGNGSQPTAEQSFYLMQDKDYFLTEVVLSNDGAQVASNYICPIYSEAKNLFLPKDANNRFLTVPFDNDGYVTYGSFALSKPSDPVVTGTRSVANDSLSFEVTSIFNGVTQEGLVVGSVDHDTWKTGIRITGSPFQQSHISKLEAFCGVTHPATRDHYIDSTAMWFHLQPHGTVKGRFVKSARIMVGLFDDWRTGLETYGEVNAQITPKRPYNGPTVYGWTSWGDMKKNCNFEGVMSVSDHLKQDIMDKGWAKNGVVYCCVDSWDNMNWDQRKAFADRCHANGQKAGCYWTPWNDWSGSDSRSVEGNNGYTYGQARVKVDGRTMTGRVDPTSPAAKSRIDYQIGKLKACGFDYIKMDFMTEGCKEADSYYNPEITTGMQAYNYGMKYLLDRIGDDMFVDLSISPLFPSQYGNARRISCDAWDEMWHTSYMMNSLSFGWWLDRVYSFNNPDHIVMGTRSDEENVSRMASAAVTGYCILGDNLSTEGSYIGNPISQKKCRTNTSYELVNEIIDMGRSFRPAYGHLLSGPNNSVKLFYLDAKDSYVIAHFNYGESDYNESVALSLMNIDPANIDLTRSVECFTGASVDISNGNLKFISRNLRARLFRLYKKNIN